MFKLNKLVEKERQGKIVSFAGLLPRMLQQYQLREPFTIETIRRAWPGIAGEVVAKNSMPVQLKDNILYVSSKHPAISNEISMMKQTIISTFNERFKTTIKDIKTGR